MTKKAEDLQRRIQETKNKAEKYAKENSIHTHTSEFRGCKKCGSKLATKYVRGENCPLCGNDLRSETVTKTLKGYRDKISALTKEYEVEAQKTGRDKEEKNNFKNSYQRIVDTVDYILEERNGCDFKEVVAKMGGDTITYRIYADGTVFER